MIVVAIISVVSLNTSAASTKHTYTSKSAVVFNARGKLDPAYFTFYMAGKRTYTIESSIAYGGKFGYAASTPKSVIEKTKQKLRYDITVIEADGSKSNYYGKSSGFSFKLKYNRTYKVYVTSYVSDYKTANYGSNANGLAVSLNFNIKY